MKFVEHTITNADQGTSFNIVSPAPDNHTSIFLVFKHIVPLGEGVQVIVGIPSNAHARSKNHSTGESGRKFACWPRWLPLEQNWRQLARGEILTPMDSRGSAAKDVFFREMYFVTLTESWKARENSPWPSEAIFARKMAASLAARASRSKPPRRIFFAKATGRRGQPSRKKSAPNYKRK